MKLCFVAEVLFSRKSFFLRSSTSVGSSKKPNYPIESLGYTGCRGVMEGKICPRVFTPRVLKKDYIS
jgi:hypothetical protein